MADDVTVINNSGNVGTDYVVSSDEISVAGTVPTGQVQFVKLVDGTPNGTTPIAGGANGLKVDPSNVTSPVSAASWPLPTGAATETTIAAILAKFPGAALVQGHGTAAAALRVELPTDGTGVVGLNAGANIIGSLTANQSVNTAQFGGSNVVTGTGTGGAGIPRVTVSSDSAVSVSGTITTTPPANATTNVTQFGSNNVVTGTGSSGVGIPRVTVAQDSTITAAQGTAGTVGNKWPISVTDGSSTAAVKNGTAAVAADAALVVTVSPNNPITSTVANVGADGAITEPSVGLAAGWDGLNVRSMFVQTLDSKNTLNTTDPPVRRVLEQILLEVQARNAIDGVSPNMLNALPSKPDPLINGTVTSITSTTTAQPLAGISINRSGLSVYNNSTAILYILAARVGTVSSTLFTVLLNPNDYWEAPQGPGGCYKGAITGVWASANGTAMVTEYTA